MHLLGQGSTVYIGFRTVYKRVASGLTQLSRHRLVRKKLFKAGVNVKAALTSLKAGVHVKAVFTSLNTAFVPISRSRFKRR